MAPATAGPSTTPAPTTTTSSSSNPAPVPNKDSRIHTHSHIKGLGLSAEGHALPTGQGFVGQAQAREALGLHLGLLRSGKYSGRPLLLVGPPGTGKVSPRSPAPFLIAHQGCSLIVIADLYVPPFSALYPLLSILVPQLFPLTPLFLISSSSSTPNYRSDRPLPSPLARTRSPSPLLPHGRKRGIQRGSEKDRGAQWRVQESHR
jgi:hypothetical protein